MTGSEYEANLDDKNIFWEVNVDVEENAEKEWS